MIDLHGINSLLVVTQVVSQKGNVVTLECGHTVKSDPGWKVFTMPCSICTTEVKKLVLEHAKAKGFRTQK